MAGYWLGSHWGWRAVVELVYLFMILFWAYRHHRAFHHQPSKFPSVTHIHNRMWCVTCFLLQIKNKQINLHFFGNVCLSELFFHHVAFLSISQHYTNEWKTMLIVLNEIILQPATHRGLPCFLELSWWHGVKCICVYTRFKGTSEVKITQSGTHQLKL